MCGIHSQLVIVFLREKQIFDRCSAFKIIFLAILQILKRFESSFFQQIGERIFHSVASLVKKNEFSSRGNGKIGRKEGQKFIHGII